MRKFTERSIKRKRGDEVRCKNKTKKKTDIKQQQHHQHHIEGERQKRKKERNSLLYIK